MKIKFKRLTSVIVVFAILMTMFLPSAMAAEKAPDGTLATIVSSSYPVGMIDSVGVSQAPDNGTVTLKVPSGKVGKTIWIMGNKNGGGANAKITIQGSYTNATARIDGKYYKISNTKMSSEGAVGPKTLTLNYDIEDTSMKYNLIFILCE